MDKKEIKCEQEGCNSIEVVECTIYDPMEEKTHIEHYCADHCYENGYCYICGGYFAGLEGFEFNNKSQLCENCDDMLKAELDDEWEEGEFPETMGIML